MHSCYTFFFFNDTATTEIYTLSLHDALPISATAENEAPITNARTRAPIPHLQNRPEGQGSASRHFRMRSEEHTSELQSQSNLVCRLLLEKKKHTTPSDGSPSTISNRLPAVTI